MLPKYDFFKKIKNYCFLRNFSKLLRPTYIPCGVLHRIFTFRGLYGKALGTLKEKPLKRKLILKTFLNSVRCGSGELKKPRFRDYQHFFRRKSLIISDSAGSRYNRVMCKAQEVHLFFNVITVNHDLLYFNIGVLIAMICCKNNTNDFVFRAYSALGRLRTLCRFSACPKEGQEIFS